LGNPVVNKMSTKRLNVLLSAYACEPDKGSEPGVGWNWVWQIARFHDVWVLTRANNRASIEQNEFTCQHPNVHWVYYDLPKALCFWKQGVRGIQLYYYLWQIGIYLVANQLHRQIHFDLVHHVTFGKYWVPSSLSFLPVPFIFGPVGGGESAPAAFYDTYSAHGRVYDGVRDLARHCAGWDPLVRKTITRAAQVFATTEQTQAVLHQIGGKNVTVLPQLALSQADIDFFMTFPIRTEGPFRLVSIGRLLHWKGFHLGLKAFAQFCRSCPDSEYWIINDGPEMERLKKLAQELGIAEKVTFWGKLPKLTDVYDKLAQSDVLIHPALHEAFGNVCLEALAAGRPVICLDLGGPAVQVTERCGFKVPATTPEVTIRCLADAMCTLAKDPELRFRMAEQARMRVMRNFLWDDKGDEMNVIYQEIVNDV
jgi:glycosyltransferase involved in cell wall biosynthesis